MNVAVFDTKPYDRQYLQRAQPGDAITWQFHEFRLTGETVAASAGAASVCVFVNDRVEATCLEGLKQLGIRHVALRCAGFNNVDLETAKRLRILVTRVPAYSPHAVAEHTLALLLTLNRRIHRAYNRVRELNFSLNGLVGFDLFGKTVGIIGTGKIGRLAAQIFRGFGCQVIAFDTKPDADWAGAHQVVYSDLNILLARADIVSLHVPLFPETRHLINEQSIALMKPGAYIVNTSRGKLIDTTALITAFKSGHLGGVALDVYEEEEGIFFEDHSGDVLQDDELSRLLTFPNVLITSHQAFLTHEALTEIARVTVENIHRVANGAVPLEGTIV